MQPEAPFAEALALADEAATARLAAALAGRARRGDVLALAGGLGVGKTAFARAFLAALGHEGEVPSPTFTLVQTYDTMAGTVWHFDLYRLHQPEEALELGIEDAFADGIALIEWPEKLGPFLPARSLAIDLAMGEGPTARRAVLRGGPDWAERLVGLAP